MIGQVSSAGRQAGKILVIRGGAIGDFILTLPVFAALRRAFPQARLDVLGYPHIAPLALAGDLVDGLMSIEARALAGFFARDGALDRSLADYFAGFAMMISYLYDPDGIFRENVARCSKAQFIAGPHRPDENLNLHATQVFLKPLERLAILDADTVPRLTVAARASSLLELQHPRRKSIRGSEAPDPAHQNVGAAGGRRLALHPGSGSESKNWPEERWRDLIGQLLDKTDLGFLLVGGEAERDRVSRLSAIFPAARLEVAQDLPLVELAKRLEPCVGLVGHDSGITHLAAALGLAGLVLWGETNENVWRPGGGRMILLRHPKGLPGIAVESVLERLPELLATV